MLLSKCLKSRLTCKTTTRTPLAKNFTISVCYLLTDSWQIGLWKVCALSVAMKMPGVTSVTLVDN